MYSSAARSAHKTISALFDVLHGWGNRPARLDERCCLMEEMDAINQRYGVKTLHLAVEGPAKQDWKSKSEHRSHNYLTDINDLLTISI